MNGIDVWGRVLYFWERRWGKNIVFNKLISMGSISIWYLFWVEGFSSYVNINVKGGVFLSWIPKGAWLMLFLKGRMLVYLERWLSSYVLYSWFGFDHWCQHISFLHNAVKVVEKILFSTVYGWKIVFNGIRRVFMDMSLWYS